MKDAEKVQKVPFFIWCTHLYGKANMSLLRRIFSSPSTASNPPFTNMIVCISFVTFRQSCGSRLCMTKQKVEEKQGSPGGLWTWYCDEEVLRSSRKEIKVHCLKNMPPKIERIWGRFKQLVSKPNRPIYPRITVRPLTPSPRALIYTKKKKKNKVSENRKIAKRQPGRYPQSLFQYYPTKFHRASRRREEPSTAIAGSSFCQQICFCQTEFWLRRPHQS